MNATGLTGARRIRLSDDERGFEAVFDALLFLTILALGTVMLQAWLVTGFEEQEVHQIEQHSAQARDTMEVFLRTWVWYDYGTEDDGELLRGDAASVINEAIYLDSLSASDFDMCAFEGKMTNLLRSITAPYYNFNFTAVKGSDNVLQLGEPIPGEFSVEEDEPEDVCEDDEEREEEELENTCRNRVCAPVFHARGNWDMLALGQTGTTVEELDYVELDFAIWFIR